jgi:hypothetical protein
MKQAKDHKYWSNRRMVDGSNGQNQLTIQLISVHSEMRIFVQDQGMRKK